MNYNSQDTSFKTPFGAVKTGQPVTFRFPFGAWVPINEVYFVLRKDTTSTYFPMTWVDTLNGDNIYEVSIKCPSVGIYYYRFEMRNNDGVWYYGRDEFRCAVCGHNLPEWQLTVYDFDYKTPNFAKGGVIYHIFVDRFNRSGHAKTARSYRLHSSWNEAPIIIDNDGKYRADDFFGGNLNGITEKLPYLADLGVTILYLSPIFKAFSNHRYDTGDYLHIDELLGTEEDFSNLIEKASKLGISIILDGVFNHSGADSIYFNKFSKYKSLGAFQSQKSPYHDWYYFKKFPDDYACWWGCRNVPTLNKSNPHYRELIFGKKGVIAKWMSFGVKGWRLDVVDELPIDFTNALCKTIKSINPNALIIGEVWEDASTKVSYDELRPYLLGKQLDGVMNYPFKNAIIEYVYDRDARKFRNRIMTILENYPKESVQCLMNIIGTHDTVRIINALSGVDLRGQSKLFKSKFILDESEFNLAVKRLKLASFLQFTLPGIPSIYYGDEAGIEGYEDPINRKTFPWNRINEEIHVHYQKLGRIRKANRALFSAEFEFLDIEGLLAYRWYNYDNEELICIINPTQYEKRLCFNSFYTELIKYVPYQGEVVIEPEFFGIFKKS